MGKRGRKPGWKMTPEQIETIKQRLTGRKFSEETKAKMSAAHKGKKKTDEHRAAMSQAHKERWAILLKDNGDFEIKGE